MRNVDDDAFSIAQDGYFEEALKMRNLVQEFDSGVSILGFREHIFTGSVSTSGRVLPAMCVRVLIMLGRGDARCKSDAERERERETTRYLRGQHRHHDQCNIADRLAFRQLFLLRPTPMLFAIVSVTA